MTYDKTAWVNNTTPALNAINLNKIETGIDEAHDAINNTSTGHNHDGTDSKKVDSSDVINTPSGNIVATDIQEAITELDGQDTTIQGNLTTHESDTSTHGVAEIADVATVSSEIDANITTHSNLTTGIHGVSGTVLGTEDVDDTPVDAATTAPVSSNWAYDHKADVDAHHAQLHNVASHSDTTVTGAELNADHSKLIGIDAGAKDDQTGAEIKALYEAEANTNAYNDAAVSKLGGIDTGADVTGDNAPQTHSMATHTDEGALATLNTVDTAQVDDDSITYAKMQNVSADERILGNVTAIGSPVAELTKAQVLNMLSVEDGATADQTGAEIKTVYEGEADTNEFSDAEKTKLGTVDSNADVTGSNTPQAHEASHKATGSDEILLDELGTPTDVTTLNASTSAHGLLKKLDNSSTNFLNGQGNWAAPSGGASSSGNYSGNSTINRAIPHGLGITPKVILIVKSSAVSGVYRIIEPGRIHYTSAGTDNVLAITVMDSTNFYVGNATEYSNSANINTDTYYWVAMG